LQNLIAVYQASNYPQGGVGGQPAWTGGDTSKQRRAVEVAAQWASEGRKVITYSRSPALATHLAVRLRARGIDVVEFHGGIPVTKRVDALDKRFRDGPAQVLAATKGCLQTGYNLACASRLLHVDGEWTPSVVQQADARVLRPQQRRDVEIWYLGLRGSIDDYQRQMVDQKGLTMSAGLDYGAGPKPDAEFKHIDAILAQFVNDFATLKAPQ
jgi:SNF2 family DNA or RNA helicase